MHAEIFIDKVQCLQLTSKYWKEGNMKERDVWRNINKCLKGAAYMDAHNPCCVFCTVDTFYILKIK